METIRIEHDRELPGLATITLARPGKLNAINFRMHAEIQEACRNLADDADARVVIFTGEGRAFSAGADLGGSTSDPNRPALAAENAEPSPLRERIRSSAGNRTWRRSKAWTRSLSARSTASRSAVQWSSSRAWTFGWRPNPPGSPSRKWTWISR
ncbi:MAG: enoyl-CoA hydratase/isomerase family protein [Dehalococcoidia bacterium]|nr:enoyl-CoA hydratase/isomerase family protein [Dehalococcoidia bacterium]